MGTEPGVTVSYVRVHGRIGSLTWACDPEMADAELDRHLRLARRLGNMAEPQITHETIEKGYDETVRREWRDLYRYGWPMERIAATYAASSATISRDLGRAGLTGGRT